MRQELAVKTSLHLLIWLGLPLATRLSAAVLVFDFERDAEVKAWQWYSRGQSQLERATRFATSGNSALVFTTPAWKEGMPGWPSFEVRPSVSNWTAFDRLVVDITNPDDERPEFALLISDSKVPFRQGLSYSFKLPSRGFRRYEVPLSSFPKAVNRAEITLLHFFTQKPQKDLTLYLDNIVLLQPGESLAEPGSRFAVELGMLSAGALSVADITVARTREAVRNLTSSGAPPLSRNETAGEGKRADEQLAEYAERLKALRIELGASNLTLARLETLKEELAALPGKAERVASVIRFRKACRDAGQRADNMLVGVATSMEKILPRDMPLQIKPAREVEVSLARNEKESLQLVVVPVSHGLRKVTVRASDLQSASGAALEHRNIQCNVVGYVDTKTRPDYGTPQVGWWPDPILDFLGTTDVATGDAQAFWIRIRAPRSQPAGEYHGALTVSAEGIAPVRLGLSVRVYSFTLPDHSPLPLAITFSPEDHPLDEAQNLQAEWRRAEEYPVNGWKRHKLRWVDFLADYYINYDQLYRSGPPDFEVVRRLRDRGQLVAFNLGCFDGVSRGGAAGSNALVSLRAGYDQARALGVLDRAYTYGFDECTPDKFRLLEQTAQRLRRELPGVVLMTTSYDPSYGQDSEVKTVDAWCPLTPSFKPEQAAKARATGKQVWWYICCGPHHPHANMFVEYPAIEARLLMGAMTAKQRPDGFLYYEISIWNSRRPIANGPFTEWDPRSWTTYHGDGSWTCVGPGGTPLPTIRLENFRDGLEDFAYVCLLEEILRQREAKAELPTAVEKQWLAEAKAALAVPESLVRSMTDYSRDPAELYAWRNRIGKLIDCSGAVDVNPWGKSFGVRGFAGLRR